MIEISRNNQIDLRFIEYFREIDFDKIQLCELDVLDFLNHLEPLCKANPERAEMVVLDNEGQLRRLSLWEHAHDYSGKGSISLISLYLAQEQIKKEYFVLLLLYPEITKRDLDRSYVYSYSEKQVVSIHEDVSAFVDLMLDLKDAMVEKRACYSETWLLLCSFFHNPILFGAKRRSPSLWQQGQLQFSTMFSCVFNYHANHMNSLVDGVNMTKSFLRISKSKLLLTRYCSELPREVEERIIELYLSEYYFEKIVQGLKLWLQQDSDLKYSNKFALENLHNFQVMRVVHRFCSLPFG